MKINRIPFIVVVLFLLCSCSNKDVVDLSTSNEDEYVAPEVLNDSVGFNDNDSSDLERYNSLLNDDNWETIDVIISDSPIATYINEEERLLSGGYDIKTDENGKSKMIYKGILQRKKNIETNEAE